MEEIDFVKKENQDLKNKIQELQQNINRNNTNNSNNITNNNDKKKNQNKYNYDLGYDYLEKLKKENPTHYNLIIENT